MQTRGPVVEFNGRLVGEYSGRKTDKDRWWEGELWETPKGTWVAVAVSASNVEGEIDLISAEVHELGDDPADRQIAVMDLFGWTDGARKMARDLGWNINLWVD